MAREYFPGFAFTEPTYVEEPPLEAYLIPVPKDRIIETGPTEIVTIRLEDYLLPELDGIEEVEEREFDSADEILPDFLRVLRGVNRSTNTQLGMRKRSLKFVPKEELKPKTPEEENSLVNQYGEYMRGGGAGDCTRLPDGTFEMRAGVEASSIDRFSVMYVVAHEYGHTLGPRIEPIVFEELKADAFASLCERVDLGVDDSTFHDAYGNYKPDHPHDVAKHRLGELLRADISEGAIISHLIGRKFGRYSPKSWQSC